MSDHSRAIALLATALLALSGASAAAAEDDEGPWPLSAICIHEFSLAAERVREPEPEVATAAVTADGAGLVPTDDPLDAAVRACASIGDWLGAAELYPEVFGGLDALDHLASRCADPLSGLSDYASCQSLAAALATPSPLDPLATPEIVRPAPGLDGELAAHPNTELAPEPGAEPAVDAPAPGERSNDGSAARPVRTKAAKDGLASVSRDFRATIPGATRVRFFTIRGDTPAQLLKQNLRKARVHCRTHRAVACVDMRWSVSVVRDIAPGRCTIERAVTKLQATVHLPRWKDRGGAGRALQHWWLRVMRESAVHEAKHIRIQRKHLAAFRRGVTGKSCAEAGRILRRHMRRASRAQAAFDRVEYQKPLPPLPVSLLR